jgi:universal stress protein A
MRCKCILFPTDYSGLSETALHYAVAVAQDYGARLIVLHAVETLGPEKVSFGEVTNYRQPDDYRRRLWDEMHRHVRVPDPLVEQQFVLSEEDPAAAILETAMRFHCDLIVMGTHGRLGLKRWLEGSVAEQVIRRAPCPVLVIRDSLSAPWVPSEAGTALHPQILPEK